MLARTLRLVLVFAAMLVGVLATAAPAAADVDDFTFDSFHAELQLGRGDDGHAELTVVETIVARFPDHDQNRGIVRAIPDDYDRVPLHTEIVSVTDGSGSPIPYEVSRDGDVVEVATGDDDYVRGKQTYVISYTQRDSIRSFADTDSDEFYRDINGTAWSQPFGEVTAVLAVDAELAGALTGRNACYVGAEGASERCEVSEATDAAGAGLLAGATDLEPGENLTIAIGFDRGTFVPGEQVFTPAERFATDAAPALQGGSIAAAMIGAGTVVAAVVARRRGRDAAGRGTIVVQYEPPPSLAVLQAAHLVSRGAEGIAAAIVDLAVSRHVRIVESGEGGYRLELVHAVADDPARQRVIDAVFDAGAAAGTVVELDGDTSALAKRLEEVSSHEARALRTAGLTEARPMGAWGWLFAAVLVAFVAALGLVVFTAATGTVSWIAIVALPVTIVAGVVALLVWPYGDRVTDAGAVQRDHLIGLRDYLRLAETDRIRMLQSPAGAERRIVGDDEVLHLYERLLPYAIIWGVEDEWARALETHAAHTGVDWYSGPNGFSSAYLLASLSATQTSTSSSAQWSSSGSGSFSGGSFGGGFSGGGAGGGGGGGR